MAATTNFPLFEKVAIDQNNLVTFVEQYVHSVSGFSSQYGNSNSISYTAYNIIGTPCKFPEYGDFPQAYVMRTYGEWWNRVPSRSIGYMPQNDPDVIAHDYIDLAFDKAVYPIRVSIYEIYNPGSVVRIWAKDSGTKWSLLWSGPPQTVPPQSRIFSPPLQPCNFKTSMLRLEFNHSQLNYYTELDAVLLIGTVELILPKERSFKLSLSKVLQSISDVYPVERDIYNLTPLISTSKRDLYYFKSALNKYCVMYKSEIIDTFNKNTLVPDRLMQLYHDVPPFEELSTSMEQFLETDYPALLQNACGSSDEAQERSYGNFSVFPNETKYKILEYLDLRSLYRLSCTNRQFRTLTRDSLFYKSLNLRPYWHCFNANALLSLVQRCARLRKLDLSWCGNHGILTTNHLKEFLNQCGSCLTHLRLNCCDIVDDSVIFHLSMRCKDLRELCLRNCRKIQKQGFVYLQTLRLLEILDLYRTCIETTELCKILRCNPRLRHLNVAGVLEYLNADEIARELGNSCLQLESVDFWKAMSLTSLGINALTRCRNLREVDFSWCGTILTQNESFYRLFTCCEHLEKIFLASFRGITERDLRYISLCKKLRQLDLLGAICLTSEICLDILLNCKRLELLDLSFCDLISNMRIDDWRRQFPNVAIKRSYTIQQIRTV